MADAIILNKVASIERCLGRIEEDYSGHEKNFRVEHMRQDAIILNLQRACELSIDLANHIVKMKQLGVPQHSRDSFTLLKEAEVLPGEIAEDLIRMVTFRNIAVHQYQDLNLTLVARILSEHLSVFKDFNKVALGLA